MGVCGVDELSGNVNYITANPIGPLLAGTYEVPLPSSATRAPSAHLLFVQTLFGEILSISPPVAVALWSSPSASIVYTVDPLFPSCYPGDVIFFEVMLNPDAVSDGAGEWFELYNTTDSTLDLQGYAIDLGDGAEAIGSSVSIASGGYALFAINGNSGSNGGLPTPDYVYSSAGQMDDASGSLVVIDPQGRAVVRLNYDTGVSGTFPAGVGSALVV